MEKNHCGRKKNCFSFVNSWKILTFALKLKSTIFNYLKLTSTMKHIELLATLGLKLEEINTHNLYEQVKKIETMKLYENLKANGKYIDGGYEYVRLFPTVYKILRKSMVYVYFTSCFNEPLLFRLLLQRSSTVGFSASVNSVVRLPTNILFPSINMLIAAFKSLS